MNTRAYLSLSNDKYTEGEQKVFITVRPPFSQVLFTGVVDEEGERVLARLGGSMAKGVADMNCLVTDKVRRTVKFLCAVAKGVPIVTPHWLKKVRLMLGETVPTPKRHFDSWLSLCLSYRAVRPAASCLRLLSL